MQGSRSYSLPPWQHTGEGFGQVCRVGCGVGAGMLGGRAHGWGKTAGGGCKSERGQQKGLGLGMQRDREM